VTRNAVETDPARIDPTRTDPASSPRGSQSPGPEVTSPGPIARCLAGLVRLYQLVVSPWLGPSCRFEPSCSAYALEALRVHGAARGTWLTLRRLGRCQPFCTGGYDPVPEPRNRKERCASGSVSVLDPAPSADGARVSTDHVSTDHLSASRLAPGRGTSSQSPVASGSPDRGVPAC
jgi:putative membrane protein insertion efficiency factor